MSETPPADATVRDVLSPSELVRQVRAVLEGHFPLLWVEGEISNLARPVSGHLYFSLKDATAQIRCAMFRPRSSYLRFRPSDGIRVLVRARVSLYEARGEFQLIVEHMEEAGEGALLRAFAALKQRLAAEGLFDPSRKRPLPRLPRRIGVITSPTGAAIRDVLSVIRRRFPLVEIELLPVPVQGKEAPSAIVGMLAAACAARRHDVLLLTRGGGSLEDLWAFNEESVARAIAACSIPVVSAIGHEIDFTIADFVADLRAPTPSAAAELLTPDATALLRLAEQRERRLRQQLRHRLDSFHQRLDHALIRLRAQHPRQRLRTGAERLAQLGARLQRLRPTTAIHRYRTDLGTLRRRLRLTIAACLRARAQRLAELARTAHAVSPLATLERGYGILLERDTARLVRTVEQARTAERLIARLSDGTVPLRYDSD
jgi:exodeoxyribonuclease VII large subunit